MQVVRVSGTIKKAEEEAIRCARVAIRRTQNSSEKINAAALGGAFDAPVTVDAMSEGDDVDMGFSHGIEDPDEPGDFDDEEN